MATGVFEGIKLSRNSEEDHPVPEISASHMRNSAIYMWNSA